MVVYHDRNLIINYIPRNLSDIDLSNLFSTVGPIKTCRIIRDHNSGSSFGFGFCEYEYAESAHRAIERFNGYRIADKVLKVSLAKLQGRLYQSSNLYVKNFPLSVTDEQISTEFSRFGKVLQCRILRDRESNASKGSAYVLFENRSDAEKARNGLDGFPWPATPDGPLLSIKFATPPYRQPSATCGSTKCFSRDAPQTSVGEFILNDQLGANGLQGRAGFISDPGVPSPNVSYFPDNMYASLGQTAPGVYTPLFAVHSPPTSANIPWSPEYASESLPFPLNSTYVSPYWLAQYPSLANFWPSVQANLNQQAFGLLYGQQLDGLTNAVHGCPIFTGLPANPLPTNGQYGNVALRGVLSGLLTEDDGVRKPKFNRFDKTNYASVYVYNIGNLMTERRLCELFGRFGVVLNVSIPRDPKTNFTRNFGFVTFNSVHSAYNAINTMNGFIYDGRRFQVSLRKPKASTLKTPNDNSSKLFVDVADQDDALNQGDRTERSVDSGSASSTNEKALSVDSCAENLASMRLENVLLTPKTINDGCPPGIKT